MNATIITIDLAKSIFELALANAQYRIVQRHRFDRDTFSTFMQQQLARSCSNNPLRPW